MQGWFALVIAGMFEVGFTTFLKLLSQTPRRWIWLPGFGVCAVLSFVLLARSLKIIPLGTAYAVWTGIGAAGTAIIGIVAFGEPLSLPRVFFLTTLIGSIIGLKYFST